MEYVGNFFLLIGKVSFYSIYKNDHFSIFIFLNFWIFSLFENLIHYVHDFLHAVERNI